MTGRRKGQPITDNALLTTWCFKPRLFTVSILILIKCRSALYQLKQVRAPKIVNTAHKVRITTRGLIVSSSWPLKKYCKRHNSQKIKVRAAFVWGLRGEIKKDRDMPYVIEMVKGVKELGLETCMTLGMLSPEQAAALQQAGLDYYNHNLDTSPEFYGDIITTRTYQDRLNTLRNVRDAGMKVCAGGIVGMGESVEDRASLLVQLANLLPKHPESVPINMLVKVKGTPFENLDDLDPIDFVRTIAVARILMPASHVRLSAGREYMSDEMQAMCFLAGANSIFYGEVAHHE